MNVKHGSLVVCLFSLLIGCGKQEAPPSSTSQKQSTEESSGYLGTITKAHKTAVSKVETTAINQAINMFESQEGRRPKDLNELISKKYLRELPKPPHGMKFEYNSATGEASVVAE